MLTAAQWKEAKQLQEKHAEWRKSDLGEAVIQVLTSMMVTAIPVFNLEGKISVIESEAMSSASIKGYLQCMKNLESLNNPAFLVNEKKAEEEESKSSLPVALDHERLKRVRAGLPTV